MPSPVVIWIWFCAYLNCAGWTLSVLHQLNQAGYAVVFALGLGTVLYWKQKTGAPWVPKIHLPKLYWRFRRAFPLGFLILAGLAFLGGALHTACNYDALAYRTPRVLHWLDAQQWIWIPTEFARLNTRTAGFEWLTAPQFLFLHTDRFVFLLNIVSFLLLPGRIFAVLARLGVRPRAAWHWMWLFPSGYGYVLQAGSVVNDMFGAVMALTAIEFALRAVRGKNVSCLWTSGLAAALMTAVKAFNIVLLLPWAVAALPALKLLPRRPAASFAVILLAASASIVPTAIVNLHQCGDWTGLKAEQATIGGGGKLVRFVANAVNLPIDNLVPPIFPFTRQWEQFVNRTLSPEFVARMKLQMEGGLVSVRLPEMQMEETAGIGLGLTLLLLVLLVKKIRAGEIWPQSWHQPETLVPLTTWLALGVLMMQSGAAGPARYLSPFYLLLAAPILQGSAADKFFRQRGWRGVALGLFAVAGLLLVLSPPRPLWPTDMVLRAMNAKDSSHYLLHRAWNVYTTYGSRADGFNPVIAALPADANPLGYLAADEPEAGLWRPFGQRRILHIRYDDTPASVRACGLKYALVSEDFLAKHGLMKPAEWVQSLNAQIVQHFELKMLAGQAPRGWLLIRFQ